MQMMSLIKALFVGRSFVIEPLEWIVICIIYANSSNTSHVIHLNKREYEMIFGV